MPPANHRFLPSGLKATSITHSGASSSRKTERSAEFQIVTLPFSPAVANIRPSGDQAARKVSLAFAGWSCSSFPSATRKIATFRLDDDLLEGMKLVQERDGVPPSEQARRAIRSWLETKGALKPDRKRAGTRKRP